MALPFRHSLRWQIQLYYTALMALIMTTLAVGLYHYEKRLRVRALDHELSATILPLTPRLNRAAFGSANMPGGRGFRQILAENPTLSRVADLDTMRERLRENDVYARIVRRFYVAMLDPDGVVMFTSENAPETIEYFHGAQEQGEIVLRWSEGRREAVSQNMRGLQFVVGMSGAQLDGQMRQLAAGLTLVAVSATVLFSLLGGFLLDRGLRPISEISETARKISQGDLQERIPADQIQNELGPLANLLNATFGRLDESIQAQRRYNADASHELRTPLAIIMADCDYSLKRERPPERYLKTIRTCREAAEHMAVLVEDLNLIAKADAAALRLKPAPGDLAEFLREIVNLTAPLAHAKGIAVETDLTPAPATFDPNLLRQVCVNLIGNAVTYNRPAGKIILRTGRTDNGCFVEIEDTGVGISPEDLPHIFDRFYRADKARGHVQGKTGLGLAITQTILEAHGGTITARSELGAGTCFRMELPGQT